MNPELINALSEFLNSNPDRARDYLIIALAGFALGMYMSNKKATPDTSEDLMKIMLMARQMSLDDIDAARHNSRSRIEDDRQRLDDIERQLNDLINELRRANTP